MNHTPTVSVIMTVYNGERFVEDAIQSVLHQTLQDLELVIVDDGSTDGTSLILQRYTNDPRVKVIRCDRIGRGKALNVAWQNTSGTYIANLDADDKAYPERLERQVEFLNKHPDIGMLGTACTLIDENGLTESELQRPVNDDILRVALIKYNPFVHSSVMMPRHSLQDTNGYNEELPVTIDYDLWVRISKSYKIANLPSVLTYKRTGEAAFFRNRIPSWLRYKCHLSIQWNAWANNSYPPKYFHYILLKFARYLVTRIFSIFSSAKAR